MRHRVKKHLHLSGMDKAQRKSAVRNLLTGLFTHKSIQTTEKRALAITPLAHRLIDVANSEHTEYNKIRMIGAELFTKEASVSLLALAGKYKDQNGGYTRITPIKYRDGDAAKLVRIELV
ncbi:MAG: bL17 family ribosomal protein [Candidatus Gracilibacteria bacterium]|nr:bL17 family ribosomal protein [Candidatus Gracilibacteria bacterium]